MGHNILRLLFLTLAFHLSLLPTRASALTIPTVPVGNAGNAPDPLTGNLYGSVSYEYRIGRTEVTNSQYVEFLNAKAASDPLALYSSAMTSDSAGGITRAGVSGSYAYEVKANMGNKPVNYVTWYDAIRFANWLHNGQGDGDTETGAYTLLGGTPTPSNGLSVTRNPDATWFLPTEDEWYKSAYHQPATQGGDTDDYWLYSTASNSVPTLATVNAIGDIDNPGPNVVNYGLFEYFPILDWNSRNVTTVGSAGPLSDSFYGTADQSGNVDEWNEALIITSHFVIPVRGVRGGSFILSESSQQSLYRDIVVEPTVESALLGFRVATVPEPSTYALGALAMLGLFACGRRTR